MDSLKANRFSFGLRRMLCIAGAAILAAHGEAGAGDSRLGFAVINQRSPTLTAQYWNPILDFVSRQSGVTLELRMGRTAPETTAMTERGEFEFVYSNHLFTPERDRLGYRVIARPDTPGISGQIVVPGDSAIKRLEQLAGKEMASASKEAFVGYWVPMDALLRAGIKVVPVFAGNQEGAMGQLKAGRVPAAAVNSEIMKAYAQREGVAYRVLWSSEPFLDVPIMAAPSVPSETAERVAAAFASMSTLPEGRDILLASASVLKQSATGFVRAGDRDYDNYRSFYRRTLVTP